ncbi:DUF1905 domain-containing protein [Candidatus Kaiserbacteria bacterium]|nr:DUF1905 domain-containing protein [Candidatus Kaiserbacteria bacterium]
MKTFAVKGKVWRYPGAGGWHFVYLNEKLSRQIKDSARTKKVGLQFVRVRATIGKTSWQTTLFPTKEGPYLIAVKADVRKKESIDDGDIVEIKCELP